MSHKQVIEYNGAKSEVVDYPEEVFKLEPNEGRGTFGEVTVTAIIIQNGLLGEKLKVESNGAYEWHVTSSDTSPGRVIVDFQWDNILLHCREAFLDKVVITICYPDETTTGQFL